MLIFNEINWLAVLLASLTYFMLGALWFTPLFGKQYDKATGVHRPKGKVWPSLYYYGPLFGCTLSALAISVLFYALNIENLSNAFILALTAGIGFSFAVSFTNAITPNMPKPVLFSVITGSYHVTGLCLVVAILHIMN